MTEKMMILYIWQQLKTSKFNWFSVPPHWTVEPTDSNVASGQDVTLHCQADGYPLPSITWRKAVGQYDYHTHLSKD